MPRLACCQPTAYDGASRTVVHGPLCDKVEEPLSAAEMAEWIGHPVSRKPVLRVVTPPVPTTRTRPPRRRPEKWFVGITPELEDFS